MGNDALLPSSLSLFLFLSLFLSLLTEQAFAQADDGAIGGRGAEDGDEGRASEAAAAASAAIGRGDRGARADGDGERGPARRPLQPREPCGRRRLHRDGSGGGHLVFQEASWGCGRDKEREGAKARERLDGEK